MGQQCVLMFPFYRLYKLYNLLKNLHKTYTLHCSRHHVALWTLAISCHASDHVCQILSGLKCNRAQSAKDHGTWVEPTVFFMFPSILQIVQFNSKFISWGGWNVRQQCVLMFPYHKIVQLAQIVPTVQSVLMFPYYRQIARIPNQTLVEPRNGW